MKLLICTQVVDKNHDVLGFFHDWIREFAKRYDKVTVVCLERGEYDLPENVKVVSLGKKKRVPSSGSRAARIIDRLKYIFRFYGIIWRERKNYNRIFIHMNSEYVVLGGWLWKLTGKRIGLWYVHKALPWQLRLAEKFVDVIFTASKESCSLKSGKIRVVGHGVNIGKFEIRDLKFGISANFNVVYVGRISKIKNQELLIRAAGILREDGRGLKIKLIGGTIYPEDEKYKRHLLEIVKKKKLDEVVEFIGSVPNKDIFKHYKEADLSVNLCPTGGMDKAVLESIARGVPVVVHNKTFLNILEPISKDMILEKEDAPELARKISIIAGWSKDERERVGKELKKHTKENFSLENLIKKIII